MNLYARYQLSPFPSSLLPLCIGLLFFLLMFRIFSLFPLPPRLSRQALPLTPPRLYSTFLLNFSLPESSFMLVLLTNASPCTFFFPRLSIVSPPLFEGNCWIPLLKNERSASFSLFQHPFSADDFPLPPLPDMVRDSRVLRTAASFFPIRTCHNARFPYTVESSCFPIVCSFFGTIFLSHV